MLTKKSIELFHILKNENNLKVISKKMNLTERAVRYERENLFFYLKKFKLFDFSEIEDVSSAIKKISNYDFLSNINKDNYNFSKEDRESYIFSCYLFGNNSKQKFFEENLNASTATIASDIQKIKKRVKSLGLEIEKDTKKGNYIIGKEKKIRQVMLNFLLDYLFKENLYFLDLIINEIIEEYFKNLDISLIEKFLIQIQMDLEKTISDEAHKILKIYLMILVKRVEEYNFITEIKNKNMIESSDEYKSVSKRFPPFCSANNVSLFYEEKYLLTEYILGSHSYNFSYSYYENWFQLEILVSKLIVAINNLIDVNILGDNILVEGLLNHIRPAIYRIKQGIKLENNIYYEVYKNDPYLFKIIKSEIEKFKDYFEIEINDDEIAFLTIHFREAINRREATDFKNIIIVCGFGYGSSKLLKENIRNYFDVNIVGIMPLHRFYEIEDFSEIDMVITTVPIKNKNLKIVRVNPILSEEDLILLEKEGLAREKKRINVDEFIDFIEDFIDIDKKKILKQKILEKYPQKFLEIKGGTDFLDLLKIENIYTNKKFENWEESINFLGEILIEEGVAKKGYISSIINALIEHGSYMVLEENILLAHGKNDENVLKTSIYLMVLDEEIQFPNGKNIKFIILFSSKDGKEHTNALLKLTELIVEKKLFKKIDKSFNREKVYNLIQELLF